MEQFHNKKQLVMLTVIVNFGLGSKVLKLAKESGIIGGTIFLGKGTVKNKILEFLDLSDVRKEIVLMISDDMTAHRVMEELNDKLHFSKPNHGIAFSSNVMKLIGSKNSMYSDTNESRGADSTMYDAIYVIVEKGNAEDVIDAATEAGARGGTIINARGSGIHETSKLFAMEIEPEKEVVLILSESNITDTITANIQQKLKIDQPGNGIIYIQSVNKTIGLR